MKRGRDIGERKMRGIKRVGGREREKKGGIEREGEREEKVEGGKEGGRELMLQCLLYSEEYWRGPELTEA